MRLTMILVAALALALASGCGGDDPPPEPDALFSICGQPGDVGNSVGVGKFCETLADCTDTPDAPLCSRAGDPTTFFCTNLCDVTADAGPSSCGEDTACECGNGGCGCTPNICLE